MADIIATWKDIFAGFVCINSASGYGTADINAVITALESVCGGATTDDIELGLTRCPTKAEIESMAFWCPESDWTLDLTDIADFCNYYEQETGDTLYNYNKLIVPSTYSSNQLVCKYDIIGRKVMGQQYQYLQTNGGAYIPLAVTLQPTDVVIVSYYIGTWSSNTIQSPLGTRNSCNFQTYKDGGTNIYIRQNNGLYLVYNILNYTTYQSTGAYIVQRMVINGTASDLSYSISNSAPFTLTGSDPGKFTVNSWNGITNLTATGYSGTLTALSATSTGTYKVSSKGRIYGIEIYRDDELYRKYVSNCGTTKGLLEVQTNTLYTPSAGTVTAGGSIGNIYIDTPNYLNQIGTLE